MQALHVGDRGKLLAALALLGLAMLPALQPLMVSEPTCGYDNAFHLWRAIQIEHLWDQGVLYSRWAPDMAHGFGFPLYLFASPFPPALVALLHRIGLTWPVALNAVFALGMGIGGYGMFWLAYRLVRGEEQGLTGALVAGVIAGTAYVYAPFQAYDVYNRGSLWEAFAWASPPLLLLGMHEWSVNRDRRFLLLGAGGLGAMLLSHHVFAFLFGPVFALWIVMHAVQRREWGVLWRGLLVTLLGLGWTAFFWMPPFLEKPWVQADRLLSTWVFDYRYNFLMPGHLFALPRVADPRLLNDWPEKALGLVPVLLALLPIVGLRRASRPARWRLGLLWGLVVVFVLLMLPVSLWLWDRIPLLVYVQFPWRYLGPAAFCLALLTGLGAASLRDVLQREPAGPGGVRVSHWQGWGAAAAPAVVLAVVMVSSMGWLYPRHCAAVSDTSMASLIAWERVTDTLGTTAKGEYLPKWVEDFPEGLLDEDYAAGGPIVRLHPDSLPNGATIVTEAYGAIRARLTLKSPSAFQARYLAFYYPGWHVEVDGEPVPVVPEAGSGVVTFGVPAGRHDVEIWFGETPARLVADAASALSVLVLLLIAAGALGRRPDRGVGVAGDTAGAAAPALAALAGAIVLVWGVKWLLVDTSGVLWRSTRLTPDGILKGLDAAALSRIPAPVNFGNQALLLGMEPVPDTVAGDDETVLTLYWRGLAPAARDWRVGLTLTAGKGGAESDAVRWPIDLRAVRWARGAPPLIEWAPADYARMDFHMDLPSGLPPGEYEMQVALFDRATAEPASVLDAGGNPIAPSLSLGSIRVDRPRDVPDLAALDVSAPAPAEAAVLRRCGAVGLWQAEFDRETAAPGDVLGMRAVWEAIEAPSEVLTLTVELVDAAGTVARTWTLPPAAASWPTTAWQPGDRWVGQASLRLPGSLETGAHTLLLKLGRECALGTFDLAVVAPERAWELPAGFSAVAGSRGDETAVLGDGERALVRLAGTRLSAASWQPGDTIDLALAWEALAEIPESYRVFVHLLDGSGHLVAQNDGEPVSWTRPTTGWAVGEVVSEARPLEVPWNATEGIYRIRVGLYVPGGNRLATPTGEDGIVIAEITVEP